MSPYTGRCVASCVLKKAQRRWMDDGGREGRRDLRTDSTSSKKLMRRCNLLTRSSYSFTPSPLSTLASMGNATEEPGSAALSTSVEQMRISNAASPASEVRALLTALRAHSTSLQPKPLLRSTPFCVTSSAENGSAYTLHSWKTLEYAYRKVSVVGVGALDDMPSLARGLFTVDARQPEGGEEEEERIVVRGYDKFFSVGELPWTKVSGFFSVLAEVARLMCSPLSPASSLSAVHNRPVRRNVERERLHHLHLCLRRAYAGGV